MPVKLLRIRNPPSIEDCNAAEVGDRKCSSSVAMIMAMIAAVMMVVTGILQRMAMQEAGE